MNNYLPYLALIAAALLLYWVKTHQGNVRHPVKIDVKADEEQGFDRNTTHLVYSKHARCRMDCRKIDESEVKEILENGKINVQKIEESKEGISYPLEGYTSENQHVRVVFAPHNQKTVVVTVIDLDNDWPCDCP